MSGERENELIRLGLLKPGPDQVVKVHPAKEQDTSRAFGGKRQKIHSEATFVDVAPIRCQIYQGKRLLTVVPVTVDDMGHPSDVVYKPPEKQWATHLVFLWAGKVFRKQLGEVVHFSPSKPLHLALRHLKLRDKFGTLVLEAGKG